jgi:hypothetical protein
MTFEPLAAKILRKRASAVSCRPLASGDYA